MVRQTARECRLEMAALYGYVVMPHHIHLVVRPRPNQTISAFMSRFKPHTGAAVTRILSPAELSQFDQQRGLNENTFWQRSFRSIVIEDEHMFWQKMEYIHSNPIRAGYVERAEDYSWSSARLVSSGGLREAEGLDYAAVADSLRA